MIVKESILGKLRHSSVDSAVNYFLDLLAARCEEFIPRSKMVLSNAAHSWLDAVCEAAIKKKIMTLGLLHGCVSFFLAPSSLLFV